MMLWLFERNHWESEWRMVARCVFVRYGNQSFQIRRCWRPTARGHQLYHYAKLTAALQFYACEKNWREQESGIGCYPGEAVDYGAAARAVLEAANAAPLPDPGSGWQYDRQQKRYISTKP
jgi:hypothetical protein